MSTAVITEIRDAGPLLVDDEFLAFEDDDRSDHEATACLAEPWVTATTRVGCDWNS
ncbi:SflA family class IV lanthipeptide [Kitasatospora sp. NPDC051853]|uniref:SflA family class IV lanthipeptide n=1 Tax=Kitasatospora sp. NPDC051853 TaxID=3364058 RepID=UPI0037B82164